MPVHGGGGQQARSQQDWRPQSLVTAGQISVVSAMERSCPAEKGAAKAGEDAAKRRGGVGGGGEVQRRRGGREDRRGKQSGAGRGGAEWWRVGFFSFPPTVQNRSGESTSRAELHRAAMLGSAPSILVGSGAEGALPNRPNKRYSASLPTHS